MKAETTDMPAPNEPRQRPDARPMRLMLGLGGLAALSAVAGAIVGPQPPATAQDVAADVSDTAITTGAGAVAPGTGSAPASAEPSPIIKHVKRYIQLAPGQTPAPKTLVTQLPAPTPRPTAAPTQAAAPKAPAPPPATPKPQNPVTIVTTQSGAKP